MSTTLTFDVSVVDIEAPRSDPTEGLSYFKTMENRRYYELLGSKLREEREAAGLTQEQLAKVVGLSRTSVTNIERGRQRLMLDQFEMLCSAVGKTSVDLLRGSSASLSNRAEQAEKTLQSLPAVANFVNEVKRRTGKAK